jgi:hypothetical protein
VIKLHILLDLRGSIPVLARVSDGLVHDINILDEVIPKSGSIYLLDRGYLDYTRLYHLHLCQTTFVIRAKYNIQLHRIYSNSVDKPTELVCHQIILFMGYYASRDYPGCGSPDPERSHRAWHPPLLRRSRSWRRSAG